MSKPLTGNFDAGPQNTRKRGNMWACDLAYCDYIYNPAVGDPGQGVPPGTDFVDLPENWLCPKCGITTDYFHIYE